MAAQLYYAERFRRALGRMGRDQIKNCGPQYIDHPPQGGRQ